MTFISRGSGTSEWRKQRWKARLDNGRGGGGSIVVEIVVTRICWSAIFLTRVKTLQAVRKDVYVCCCGGI